MEESAAVPTETSEINEELRETFEAVEIPAEVIAESIALAKQEEEAQRAEPTGSELALFDDVEAEHSAAAPELEVEAEYSTVAGLVPEVAENKTAGVLAVVTSPFKPPIFVLQMPIHSLPGSSTMASFADPELAEFEAMDLDAQLDKLEKLSSTLGKAKSKAVDEAVDRVKIWQSTELDLPSFKAFEFCKATHEANLVDYQKQKAELDMMVADYKETKTATDKLEKHIEELQKQLASLRGKQNMLRLDWANMVSTSRLSLEIAEASIHQGMLLQKEISAKKTGLQETLKKLGL
ncbi:unnamed protein product [Prunus brigantina]